MAGTSNWDSAYNFGKSALNNIGDAMTYFGNAATAKGNAEIARLNREKMDRNYEATIKEVRTNRALNLASNRMEYILSGFQVGAGGSTDLVQNLTSKVYAEDIAMLRKNQFTDSQIFGSQIRSYKDEAKANKRQGIMSGAMGAIDVAATIMTLIA